MKSIATFVLAFLITSVYGQTDDFNILLDSAKTMFKGIDSLNRDELDLYDYYPIAELLEKSIQINPNSSEAHYFLGYSYSRINSKDGQGINESNLDLVIKASEQFEKVISLTPYYSGEILVLDPYSKLTAEWGALALNYLTKNKIDSAKWAFMEGKRRGGYGDCSLGFNRQVLRECDKDAILMSSGDISTFPLWYLQIVEGVRTDVSVIDISLLNSSWYPTYLSLSNTVTFDFSNDVLDTIQYVYLENDLITINDFSWVVKPSYYEQYLVRSEQIFLSLLKSNNFQREVYFTFGFSQKDYLGLSDYLSSQLFLDKLDVLKKSELTFKQYKRAAAKSLNISGLLNPNSQDDLLKIDFLRYVVICKIDDFFSSGQEKKARELLKVIDQYADEKKYPYYHEQVKKYADNIRQEMKRGIPSSL